MCEKCIIYSVNAYAFKPSQQLQQFPRICWPAIVICAAVKVTHLIPSCSARPVPRPCSHHPRVEYISRQMQWVRLQVTVARRRGAQIAATEISFRYAMLLNCMPLLWLPSWRRASGTECTGWGCRSHDRLWSCIHTLFARSGSPHMPCISLWVPHTHFMPAGSLDCSHCSLCGYADFSVQIEIHNRSQKKWIKKHSAGFSRIRYDWN